MKRNTVVPAAAGLALSLSLLCAGPAAAKYSDWYRPLPRGSTPPIAFTGVAEVSSSAQDPAEQSKAMYAKGFAAVGVVSFNGGLPSQKDAIKQAKLVGARYVTVMSGLASTERRTITTTDSRTATITTNGRVGSTNVYGNTTVQVPQTSQQTFDVRRYDYMAIFWSELPRQGFGTLYREPTDDERRASGTNSGLFVLALRNGSPAFNADVLPGDKLVSINSRPITADTFGSLVEASAGQDARIEILRGGETITKTVHMAWP